MKMDDFEWNVFNETKLFEAMVEHKPVGINKYFQMALIWNKLQEYLDITSDKIWTHLDTMYNMESLDDIDSLPFPNDEREFYLPEGEFGSLKLKKEEKLEEKNVKTSIIKKNDSKETQKVTKDVKKEERTPGKKETPRRDSKDGKEQKNPVNMNKKETRKEVEKPKVVKGKVSNMKEDDKMKTPKSEEVAKRVNKRPTRGSTRPDEVSGRKSQSPLTVTPPSVGKRRRL